MRYVDVTPAAAAAVLELGSGDPVRVYLGGLGSATTVSFAGVAGHPELAGDGRHVLIDLVGSGWSDHDDTFGHSIDEHAATVATVLDSLGLQQVTLIGHSLGGSIAISLAAQRPELVARLVVAEPNLDPGIGTLSVEIASADEDTFAAAGHERLAREQLALGLAGNPEATEFVRTLRRWSARGLHRTATSLVADRPVTFREQLAAFAGPRRYISGELTGEELEPLRAIGCDVRVVPAAGHLLMWDNLPGFVDAITAD